MLLVSFFFSLPKAISANYIDNPSILVVVVDHRVTRTIIHIYYIIFVLNETTKYFFVVMMTMVLCVSVSVYEKGPAAVVVI